MKILVTGCAGFIGYHLTEKLLKEGHTVFGIDNVNDYYDPALKWARLARLGVDGKGMDEEHTAVQGNGGFTFAKIDVADKNAMDIYVGDEHFDAVCHLAAQAGVRYSITNPQAYVSANLQGFFNMLEYCRSNPVKRFVYASSSSVYGNSTEIPYRENNRTDFPVSFYGATKKSNEVMAYSYSALYGINTIGLRFFTVYGPWGRPDMAPFLFTKAILEGEPINVFNNGDLSRDFTYVGDIVEGIYLVLTQEPATKKARQSDNFSIYNIGNSKPVELRDFISTIENISGITAQKNYLPMQQGDVKATWADTTLLRNDYGYQPDTLLKEGLAAFIEWYKDFYDRQ